MKRNTKFIIAGVGTSLILALLLSPLASSLPDGLERVLEKLAPARQVKETETPGFSPVPDYVFPGVKNERLSTGLAGAIGTVLAFGAMFVLGKALSRKKAPRATGRESD